MKITIERGHESVSINGYLCSLWHGATDKGTQVTVIVAGVLGPADGSGEREFVGEAGMVSVGKVGISPADEVA